MFYHKPLLKTHCELWSKLSLFNVMCFKDELSTEFMKRPLVSLLKINSKTILYQQSTDQQQLAPIWLNSLKSAAIRNQFKWKFFHCMQTLFTIAQLQMHIFMSTKLNYRHEYQITVCDQNNKVIFAYKSKTMD